jgi:hypothetical protein
VSTLATRSRLISVSARP